MEARMFRRSVQLILVAILLLPAGLEAQQGSRTFTPFTAPGQTGALGDEAQVFLGVLQAIRDFGLSSEADSALWVKAVRGLIAELDDPYATVLTPEDVRAFEEESTGNYAGIGVQITELNEIVTITAVFPNTPAYREGLQVGDRIVEVDGDDARDWSVADASERIRGQIGTQVVVTVERDGVSQPIPHRISREEVHVPAVTSDVIFDDIGYILLNRVARNSAQEVDSVLATLQGTRGLVFDLRRNPGGYLDESLNLSDLFLDRGTPMVRTRSRSPGSNGEVVEESAYARRAPRTIDVPIIVLVDRFSASASEIVAGALQDHDRALVIGERTFGKGTVQTVIPLAAGHMIRLTSGEWFTPNGRSLNRPRDREGRVIPPDSIGRFTSVAGRTLWGGGGVYPDLEILDDTLSLAEQEFVSAAIEAEIPFTQRVQEAAFAVAQEARESGIVPDAFPRSALDAFMAELVAEGVPARMVTDETRDYLRWRLEVALYQRLELVNRTLEVQTRRDPVLARAVELLKGVSTQDELFRAVPEAARPPVPRPEGERASGS